MLAGCGALIANALADSNPYGNASLGPATTPTEDVMAMWTLWLNRPDVQSAIHANKPASDWTECARIGYDVTWPSNLPDYQAIFAANLKVLIFSGDLDVTTCPFSSTQYAVDALTKLPGGEVTSEWTYWTVQRADGAQTGGYIEQHKSFTFATVKAGGHEAPGFQPLASFELMNAFISGNWAPILPNQANAAKPKAAKPAKLTQASILRDIRMRRVKADL